jgi:uncharacterized protein
VIVVDTNVFVALADRRDAHHTACRDWLADCDEPLIVPPTVLAEACYMIDKYLGAESEAKFLDSVGIGPSFRFQLAGLVDADLPAWLSWCGAMRTGGWAVRMRR